jgi:GNAT superfamily N-acetyltransferase
LSNVPIVAQTGDVSSSAKESQRILRTYAHIAARVPVRAHAVAVRILAMERIPVGCELVPLGLGDTSAYVELAAERDWVTETGKWRLLLSVGDGFGVRERGSGRLVATALATRYEDRVAVIGMVLVSPSFGHQGLGSALVRYLLDRVRPAVVSLYATVEGEPLYRKLGFRTVDSLDAWHGWYEPVGGDEWRTRPVRPADLPAIIEADRVAFGAHRGGALTRMLAITEASCLIEDSGVMRGYGLAWRNLETFVIGPVVASDDRTAMAVIDALARRSDGPVSVDLRAGATAVSGWLTRCGLARPSRAPLMTLGGAALPGAREQLYSPIMQALG